MAIVSTGITGHPTEPRYPLPDQGQLAALLSLLDPRAGRYVAEEARPLADHVAEFAAVQSAKGVTRKHASETRVRVERVVELTRAERIADLTADAVLLAVAGLRPGASLATCNALLSAAKQFTRWMTKSGRSRADQLVSLPKYNAALDPRHPRRVLSDDEARRLLAAARIGGRVRGLTGEDRYFFYLLAMTCGLRAGELAGLTPDCFDLNGKPPTLSVPARTAKNRKLQPLPLRPDVLVELRAYLARRGACVLFPISSSNTAKMVRVDLEAANIPYVLGGRYADVHAQRHTFCTNLGRTGASIKVVQALARHADVRMTARYMHSSMTEEVAAVAQLPALTTGAEIDIPKNRKSAANILHCLPERDTVPIARNGYKWSRGESNPDLLNAIQPSANPSSGPKTHAPNEIDQDEPLGGPVLYAPVGRGLFPFLGVPGVSNSSL